MSIVQRLMGRRQFLIAAGATSTSALAYNKLAGVAGPVLKTGNAMAAEKAAALAKGASSKYTHLFSPIKVGTHVLKSRMYFTHATPHFLQGPELFPSATMRDFYIDLAKGGAAIITCRLITDRVRAEQRGDSAHMIIYDLEDTGVQNYFDLMVEGMNIYGTKAAFDLQFGSMARMMQQMQQMQMPGGAEGGQMPGRGQGQMPEMGQGQMPMGQGEMPSGGQEGGMPGMGQGQMPSGAQAGGMTGRGGGTSAQEELTEEELEENINTMITQATFYKNHGFGVAIMRGGSDKSSIAAFTALRKAWPDVIIMSRLSVSSGIEDAVAEAKKLEGYVDILTVQESDASKSHCLSYNLDKENPGTLKYVEAIKKAGVKIAIAPNGGYGDMDLNEQYIASGKCDMVAMGRAFIADAEIAQKAYEGRGEDIIPCVRCNKCHGVSFSNTWFSVCTVNPKMGICQAVQKIQPPTSIKKVAVIGGGPAGMKAAITAAERGHKVTLYEKNSYLGGQLRHTDFFKLKWAYKDFKDYLVHQVEKNGVDIQLNTKATPEMIKRKGYDAIMVAAGAEIANPNIPGVDGKNVYNLMDVYGKEKELGKNVVIVGGGHLGVDTGMYLAKEGHKATILTSDNQLMDRGGPHQGEILQEVYRELEGFSYKTGVTTTKIASGKVYYKDASGNEQNISADSVVVYGGSKPRQEEALKFSNIATQFNLIGDCTGNCGNIQKSIRNAFFVASEI